MKPLRLAVLACSLLLGHPAVAAEPDSAPVMQEADALFRAAAAAYERHDYRAAAAGFDAAYRIAPHPVTRFNAAKAWDLAGDPVRAANDWADVVNAPEVDEPSRTTAATRLAELDRGLGLLVVSGPADARVEVAGLESAALPWTVRLSPGRHVVRIERGGQRTERSVEVSAAGTQTLQVPGSAPAAAEAAPVVAPEESEPDAAGPATMLWLGVGSLVLTGVGIGVGAGLGAAALSSRDDYEASHRFDLGARDRAELERDSSTGAFVAAGVFAAAGILFLILSGTESEPERAMAVTFP